MGILNDFERRLEGVIEGIFTKAFRTGLQPVELATRVLREMDVGKTVGVREVWVPNRYAFHLSQIDREKFARTEKAMGRELEQVARDGAVERGWGMVGPPEVTFETDPALRQGEFSCQASLVEGPTTSGGISQAAPGPPEPIPRAPGGDARLVIVEKGRPVKTFALTKDRVVIGRMAESDVVVSDPGVSRQHAEVRRENGESVIADLGSTNGTMVNASSVGEHTLEEGDRITVGRTVLEFRRQ